MDLFKELKKGVEEIANLVDDQLKDLDAAITQEANRAKDRAQSSSQSTSSPETKVALEIVTFLGEQFIDVLETELKKMHLVLLGSKLGLSLLPVGLTLRLPHPHPPLNPSLAPPL